MPLSESLLKLTTQIRRRYALNKHAKNYFSRYQQGKASINDPLVLIQTFEEDYFYFSNVAEIIRSMSAITPIRVEQLVFRSLRVGSSLSLAAFIHSRFRSNYFTDMNWARLYQSFCHGIAYRADGLVSRADISDLAKAFRVWKSIHTKMELINLEIDGIIVGDLVYDSYLRCKPAYTVNINDLYLLVIIWQSLRDIRNASAYFEKTRPALFLSSYSTYIQHGIPVRIALMKGIPVFTLGNYQEFTKQLSLSDWVHTANHSRYKEIFDSMAEQSQKRALAEKNLLARTSGTIDKATSYMRESAYANKGEAVPDVKDGLVIFLHDFFDSPHCYQWMLFPDFWEWLTHTINVASENNLKVFIKPHPNQLPESSEVVEKFKLLYPYANFLSPKINNRQLVDAGIVCGLTVYGTVAHELAFLGIPTICCGDHPHINYDFCFTAKNLTEYDQLLKNYRELPADKNLMHRQSCEFYYMHSLNVTTNYQDLLDCLTRIRTRIYQEIEPPSFEEYIALVEQLAQLPAYNETILKLTKLVSPNASHLPHNRKIH